MKRLNKLLSIITVFSILLSSQIPVYASIESNNLDSAFDSTIQVNSNTDEVIANQSSIKVYSLNNKNKDATFRFKAEDLKEILPFVEDEIRNVTGRSLRLDYAEMDYDYTEIVNKQDPSREKEILGYDFNLNRSSAWGTSTISTNAITFKDLTMLIMKSMDKPQYTVDLNFVEVAEEYYELGLFVSRSNVQQYYNRYLIDKPSTYNFTEWEVMKYKDLIVILADAMHFYGETVLSEGEVNILLQAYGQKVPMELSLRHREAFVYLAARGVIDGSENLEANLDMNGLMKILSRVKDSSSRLDYKQVQITSNLEPELVNKGLFEKDYNITFTQPLNYTSSYDYSNVTHIDILLKADNSSTFKTVNGVETSGLFISESSRADAEPLQGSTYIGKEGDYYHFKIPKNTAQSGKVLYVNSREPDDFPKYIELRNVGGGYYNNPIKSDGSVVTYKDILKFTESEPELVDINRLPKSKSLLSLFVMTTYANDVFFGPQQEYTINTQLYGDFIKYLEDKGFVVSSSGSFKSPTSITKLYAEYAGTLSSQNSYAEHTTLTTLNGENLLIDLEQAILQINNLDNKSLNQLSVNLIDDGGSTLHIYHPNVGRVILNNKEKTISTNNIIYKLPEDKKGFILFTQSQGKYMVDFRSFYAGFDIDYEITASNTGVPTVTMLQSKLPNKVELPYTQLTKDSGVGLNVEQKISVYEKKTSTTTVRKLPLASKDTLTNWNAYQYATSGGKEAVFLTVYKPATFVPENVTSVETTTPPISIKGNSNTYYRHTIKVETTKGDRIGSVTYEEGYGFVYNIPEVNGSNYTDSFNKYMSGTYILPYYYNLDTDKIDTFNKNKESGGSIVPVLVGVSDMISDVLYPEKLKSFIKYELTKCTNVSTCNHSNLILEGSNLRNIKSITTHIGKANTFRFVYLNGVQVLIKDSGDTFTVNQSEIDDEIKVNFTDGALLNIFRDIADFKFSDLVNALDYGISVGYLLIVGVAPRIMFIFLMLQLIIIMLAEQRICLEFFENVFDPIKILSLGLSDINRCRGVQQLFVTIVALTLTGLTLNGVMFKIIMFFVTAINAIFY